MCAGIQFQPPGRDIWDYGPSDSRARGGMLLPGRPSVPLGQAGMCEMIVKASAGTFKAACCALQGNATCKTVPAAILNYGSPFPKESMGFMAHNANQRIKWWNIFIEENPATDDYVTDK
jgi:hypothetical protein